MKYKQRGENPRYPNEIEIWRLGLKVPEWLSDRAKVKFIDGDGNITLEKRSLSGGGYDILDSSGLGVLVHAETMGSYICFDGSHVFSLNEKQMWVLYK
jgi:hypothetical protein